MIHFDGIIFSWQKGGGVHRYFVELIQGLGAAGIDSTVYLSRPNLGFPIAPGPHLDIQKVGIGPDRYPGFFMGVKRKLLSPLNSFLMGRRLARLQSGVFHSTYFTTYKGLRIPQVVTVHDMTYESFPEYFSSPGARRHIAAKRASIESADAIICVSETTRRALLSRYPSVEPRTHVVHHGVGPGFHPNTDEAAAHALLARHGIKKPFILFVGKKDMYKNFSFLKRAFASWNKDGAYELVTVGDGGIAATDEELSMLYGLSSAFVYPSLDEGFGLPILEALCSGARVLASDIPVFREVGGDMPIFFDPKDEASLVAALDQVAALPRLSPAERSENEARIRARFDWKKTVAETAAIYRSLESRHIRP